MAIGGIERPVSAPCSEPRAATRYCVLSWTRSSPCTASPLPFSYRNPRLAPDILCKSANKRTPQNCAFAQNAAKLCRVIDAGSLTAIIRITPNGLARVVSTKACHKLGNSKMRRRISLLFAAALLGVVAAPAFADSYSVVINDDGSGSYTDTTTNGAAIPLFSTAKSDPSGGLSEALVFALPSAVSFTSTGIQDYRFTGGESSGLIRFYTPASGDTDVIFYETAPPPGSAVPIAGTPSTTNPGELTGGDGTEYGSVTIGGNTFAFNDVPVGTPEPGVLSSILGLGGMGLIGLVWRRRK